MFNWKKIFFIAIYVLTLVQIIDAQLNEQLSSDSLSVSLIDTLNSSNDTTEASPNLISQNPDIQDPVKYSAKDSLVFDMENKTVYLYGDAQVSYQNIQLKAAYISFNMSEQWVFASGWPDSLGRTNGNPIFKEGNEEFESKWIRYNFKSKKGFVYFVKTKQGEGTLIGDSTKRGPNGEIFLKGASYSTCDLDHPHFYLRLTKAKVVPNDKVVAGPSYLVVADIPFKMIFLPFGYFPNTKKYASGILIPKYGEDNIRGISLRDGGYYFAISDYVDAKLTGEIYSKGSWGINTLLNYKVRYRFSGNLQFNFNQNVYSEKGLPDYAVKNDYSIHWSHSKDAKASPNKSFSANVNISSSSYDKRNSYNLNDYIRNTQTSSISFSRTWPNTPFSLSGTLNHEQNNTTKQVNLTLPQLSFNMNTIYPFRKEETVGELKWYENIQLNYRAQLENKIYTTDSLFLTKHTFDHLKNGFSHEIPLSLNIKITRSINLTPSLNYKGVAYTEYSTYEWNPSKYNALTNSFGNVDIIKHNHFVYAHSLYPSFSTGYTPKIYGMFLFRKSRIKAIRHVMSPSISLGFIPDISKLMPNYYYTYRYNGTDERTVSMFDQNIYGTPSPAPGKSASISFGLRNNFEMKYTPLADSVNKEKKISLLDNFDFSGNYNLMADSFALSNIVFTSGTNLFSNKLSLRFNAQFDPYKINQRGQRVNSFIANEGKRLARMVSSSLSLSTGFSSSEIKTGGRSANDSVKLKNENFLEEIPWNLRIDYSFSYQKPAFKATYIQSVRFSGDISLTKKWNIRVESGYDITNKAISITSITITRDLHCWEMSLNVIPFGMRQSYFFSINAKAAILRDLKYTKNNDAWRGRF